MQPVPMRSSLDDTLFRLLHRLQRGARLAILALACSLHEIDLIEVLNRTTRRADDLVIVLGHFVQEDRERPATAFADDFLLLGHLSLSR